MENDCVTAKNTRAPSCRLNCSRIKLPGRHGSNQTTPIRPGLWLRHAKKASGLASVSYAEALDVALCYGWIDGQKKSYDECLVVAEMDAARRKKYLVEN